MVGEPENPLLFGYESTGWGPGRANVSTHADPNPPTQMLHAALL